MDDDFDDFDGFGPGLLRWFRDLHGHQEKDWYHANRDRYEHDVRGPADAFVRAADHEARRRRLPLRRDEHRSLSRVNRDIRFSNDKRPYKEYLAAYLFRDGDPARPGTVFLDVTAGRSRLAAGFVDLDRDALSTLRQAIADDAAGWHRAVSGLADAGLEVGPFDGADDELTRMPRGFDSLADDDRAAVLRLTSFTVERPIAKSELRSPDLVDALVDLAAAAMPLLRFGWRAFDRT